MSAAAQTSLPVGPGAAPATAAFDPRAVRGPGPVGALCLRCVGVLAVVNLAGGTLWWVLSGHPAIGSVAVALIVLLMVLVACLPIVVVGWPAGLLTAHLLRRQSRERVHVAVFAAVGAVLCVVLLLLVGPFEGLPRWAVSVGLVEGAVGAGGARWWTGAAARRRIRRTGPPSATV